MEGRQVLVCALHMYEGRRMTWFSYEQDKEASDWLVVAKKEETRPPVIGPDWLWSEWDYRSHILAK